MTPLATTHPAVRRHRGRTHHRLAGRGRARRSAMPPPAAARSSTISTTASAPGGSWWAPSRWRLRSARPASSCCSLFASFTALREFLTLIVTRRGDHLALAAAFFVILPLQYYLVCIEWYGLYSIFIPVYAFLLLPIVAALRGDTRNFMPRVAEVQWALMVCVFCMLACAGAADPADPRL